MTMNAIRIDRGSTDTTTIFSVDGDLTFERTFDAPRDLVWRDEAMGKVIKLAQQIAGSDASVLITGESGTGKELIARLIHTLDPRKDKNELVILDCTTVVPELAGSEFFGHERGAFTNAVSARDGAFALADHGSLFLDEVGELPLALQPKLLRTLQEGTVRRVGAERGD